MTDDAVLYDRDDGVGQLTLNRAEDGNRMSLELLQAFSEGVTAARGDRGLRCLVVTGRGRSFCAGANLANPIQSEEDDHLSHERSHSMYLPFLTLLDVEVPVIGALNGHAIGGGFGLALLCDLRYAREDAKYGATFTKLGLHPGMAVTHLLPRLVGLPRAAEWLFTARLFDGLEGATAGLFNEALSEEAVLPKAREVAAAIAANGPVAVRLTKQTLNRGLGWDPRAAALDEAYAQAATIETRDAREGISAALERREPKFEGR